MGAQRARTASELLTKLLALHEASKSFIEAKTSNGASGGIVRAEFAIYEALKGFSPEETHTFLTTVLEEEAKQADEDNK